MAAAGAIMRYGAGMTAVALLVAALSAQPALAEQKAAPDRGDPFTTPIVPIPDPAPAQPADPAFEPLPVLEMQVGEMEIVRLGEVPSTTITTFPGIVSVGVEPPDMLFIFAEAPGETQIVVADSQFGELYARTIVVTEKP